MAFRSNGPITVALPPFRGVTRRILLTAVVVFLGMLVLALVSREMAGLLTGFLSLQPSMAYKLPWELVTYPFVAVSLVGLLFSALSVWFFGAALEDELGGRWMGEFFVATTVGGALVAMLLTLTIGRRFLSFSPLQLTSGLWPFSIALLLVFARLHADQELNFSFIFRVKAKYIASIYLLVYLAVALSANERFDALVVLTNALCGWLFLLFAPRRGCGFGANEGLYGLRNAWVRARRRRAAKKFSVYMQKQGREVHFDASGRYVDPEGKRDPNDRKWMN